MSGSRKSGAKVATLRDELLIPMRSPSGSPAPPRSSKSSATSAPDPAQPLQHPGKARPKPPGKPPSGRAGNLHELMRAAAAAEEEEPRASPSPRPAGAKTARHRRSSLDEGSCTLCPVCVCVLCAFACRARLSGRARAGGSASAQPRRARSSSPRKKKSVHKGARRTKKRTGGTASHSPAAHQSDSATPPSASSSLRAPTSASSNKSEEDEEEEDSSSVDGKTKVSPQALQHSSESPTTPSPGTGDEAAVRKARKRVPKQKKTSSLSKQLLEDARRHEAAANKRLEDEKKLRLVSEKLLSTMLARQVSECALECARG